MRFTIENSSGFASELFSIARLACYTILMNLQVGVKAIIRNSSGEVLFLRRSKVVSTDKKQTSWDIPGGRIRPGEPLDEALRREILEETGNHTTADAKIIATQDIIVPSKDMHVVRLTYEMQDDLSEIALSEEHTEHRWISIEEIEPTEIEPYLLSVLNNLRQA